MNRHDPNLDSDHTLGQHTRVPACSCPICANISRGSEKLYRRVIFDDYDEISLDLEQGLTEHQYLLCFSHVYAYALQDRVWGQPSCLVPPFDVND